MTTTNDDPLAGVPAVDHSGDDGFGVHDWQEMYLAGVPLNPDGTEDETHWINDSRLLIEHIAWQQERIRCLEMQANADELVIKASADMLASTDAQAAAMREAINWMANRMGWVADCIRRGDTNRGQAKIFDKWSVIAMDAIAGDAGRKLLERAAAMREAIGQMLAHYATEVKRLISFGYDDLQTPPALEALQAALDGDAGCRLLDRLARAEQDLSQARADALAFAREARAADTENEQLRELVHRLRSVANQAPARWREKLAPGDL